MPRTNKHQAALAAVPVAEKYLNELAAAGGPSEKVDALRLLTGYAKERAEQGIAKAERDAATMVNKAIEVPVAFKQHVYAHVEDHTHVSSVVDRSLQEFVDGEWTPADPGPRARRGEKPDSTMLNVRVDRDLWQAANARGKAPDEVAARGYSLTANQVSIAALVEAFGRPEDDSTTA